MHKVDRAVDSEAYKLGIKLEFYDSAHTHAHTYSHMYMNFVLCAAAVR